MRRIVATDATGARASYARAVTVKGVGTAIFIALAMLPAQAAADSRVSVARGVLTFFSEDVGISNRLVVEDAGGGRIRFFEPVDPFGIRFGAAPCDPGRLNEQANIIEILCARRAVARVVVDIGDGEDVVRHWSALPASLAGQLGADDLRTSAGADRVTGGQGDDVIDTGAGDDDARGDDGADRIATRAGDDRVVAGPGTDVVDLGAGDDGLQSADGDADTVECGAGYDTVLADTLDRLTGCEGVTRDVVAPGGGPSPEDDVAPSLQALARSRQRLSSRRPRVVVTVTTNERALARASGYLASGGLRSGLEIASAALAGGESGRLVVRLSRAQARSARAEVRRGRRPHVRLTLSAVDRAGNTSRPRRVTISLVL